MVPGGRQGQVLEHRFEANLDNAVFAERRAPSARPTLLPSHHASWPNYGSVGSSRSLLAMVKDD